MSAGTQASNLLQHVRYVRYLLLVCLFTIQYRVVHGKSALILGATGSVGRNILKEVLDSPRFTRVGEFGRRTTALDTEGLSNKEKLIQKVIDYEKPAEGGFKDEKWDVVFIA
jgi:hypothetical protein